MTVQWNACVHRLDLGLYSHLKELFGNRVRIHVNSKGKSPLPVAQRRIGSVTLYHPGLQAQHTTHTATPDWGWFTLCVSVYLGARYTHIAGYISRVPHQNGASQARYIVEIHHSGREPSIYMELLKTTIGTDLSVGYILHAAGTWSQLRHQDHKQTPPYLGVTTHVLQDACALLQGAQQGVDVVAVGGEGGIQHRHAALQEHLHKLTAVLQTQGEQTTQSHVNFT